MRPPMKLRHHPNAIALCKGVRIAETEHHRSEEAVNPIRKAPLLQLVLALQAPSICGGLFKKPLISLFPWNARQALVAAM